MMFQVLTATAFLVAAWLLQLFVVFPIEQALRPENSNASVFSYVFLPHGAKVLVAMFLMAWSFPVIFIVAFGSGIIFDFDPYYAFCGALVAAATAIMPIWLFNFVTNRPLNYSISRYAGGNLNLFRASMLLVVAVAFMNSAFQAALAKAMLDITPDPQLSLGFLVGDIIGGFVCVVGGILFLRLFMRRGFDAR